MAIKFIDDSILSDIADSIRTKLVSSDTYKPSEMADAIDSISGGITPTGTISITQNGTVDVTNYATADVSISSASPWVDVTPDLSNVVNGGNTAHEYNSTTDELRVHSTSNGTYREAHVTFAPEANTKYRFEYQVIITSGTSVTSVRNVPANKAYGYATLSSSVSYAYETTLSEFGNFSTDGEIVFFCTWSSNVAGDVTWKNFRLYKYVGS